MKKWGQNFLRDSSIAREIVDFASLKKDDIVVEIGPGRGVLTKLIAPRVDKLIAVEIDPVLVRKLQDEWRSQPQVEIRQEDILRYELPADLACEPFKVIANIPYYITGPIIFKLLDWHLSNPAFTTAIIMVQKEVAQRLAAKPGGKEYGALTVTLQFNADVEILKIVKADRFFPAPKVDSALILIDFLAQPRVNVKNVKLFNKIVKASFAQRRKTIYNSLKNNLGLDKQVVASGLEAAGIEGRRRAETLSIAEFANLSEVICDQKNSIS